MFMRFIWHWLVLVLGLYVLTLIKPLHISFDARADLLWAAFALIVINTIIKPILIFFTLPLVVLTLGLFLLIINAIILDTLPRFVHGFHVPNFLSAFFGALLLSLITGFFTGYERRASVRRMNVETGSGKVIDI